MIVTTIRDLLDPVSGSRRSIHMSDGRWLSDDVSASRRELDGSSWWVLPGLYDADAHMPLMLTGPRQYDLFAGLWGGVAQMNVALPWQLLGDRPLIDVVHEVSHLELPRITLVMSVSPSDDSIGFAKWIAAHRQEVADLMPSMCKLYTADPNFDRNLDAVWEAGLTPVVFSYTQDDLERLLARAHAPIHFRHATSAAMVAAMRAVQGATLQTSPHFMLPLATGHGAELTVLPSPPDEADRASLTSVFLEQVDLIASDHVSPAPQPPGGPGLQTQQNFLPALLQLCDLNGWPVGEMIRKATESPSTVFGVPLVDSFVVVDPQFCEPVPTFPRQRPDRAPYLGLTLPGRVVAIGCGDAGVVL